VTTLGALVERSSVLIACGPGGVGKTTTAAALGLAIAQHSERRVLVLTIDPARRLADALGLSGIGNAETPVEIDGPGELVVSMLDTKASWDALIHRHAPDAATAQRILSNTLYQNITGRFVQSHDYIAMERLHELVVGGEYDLIIVDTPPTRNALDFLEAPTRMAEFFSSRLLRWIVAPARTGVASLAAKPFTAVADRVLGGPFVSDITEFFVLLNQMYAGFVARAKEVQALMAQESTTFVVVSTLESVPVAEAGLFVDELTRRRYHVGGWILTRVTPPSLGDPALGAALDELAHADLSGAAAALGQTEESLARVREELVVNVQQYRRVAAREALERDRLRSREVALFSIPSLDGEISGIAGLARLGALAMAATTEGSA
jgi:anion-transporting  ArsA/GET3 family ATPase